MMKKFTEERIAKVEELAFDASQRDFLDLFAKLTVNKTEVRNHLEGDVLHILYCFAFPTNLCNKVSVLFTCV